ncbi:mannan endo-1 4-beta-mannosidase [Biomphalaria pfeifferi]|uniref:Mannan endo-1 4-beta-mannosidase n=1 Tax=Biomphalaria pfeifferi TaxID=112525 RepID=A0AAD8F8H0_BIOPF|nr:mannan endo-1 4-beta-mannosidase [Biomphalaria pfeifferi]
MIPVKKQLSRIRSQTTESPSQSLLASSGHKMTITQMFDYVYNHGYAGAWSWDVVGHPDQRTGVSHIKDLTSNGLIPINIHSLVSTVRH